jgi:hypothetical protein
MFFFVVMVSSRRSSRDARAFRQLRLEQHFDLERQWLSLHGLAISEK